ncbi:hypothetical protein RvY_13979 [Ramazzottius varieornatus]|uniref:Uncharacterized protein n=1 Tax=Ramazzottius varieornatus TaxID=947166 RepID=A0A1D1VTN6_RAMVA|nr:hypothetical protein RvY_13979 [Ramazzottius varieornatus]
MEIQQGLLGLGPKLKIAGFHCASGRGGARGRSDGRGGGRGGGHAAGRDGGRGGRGRRGNNVQDAVDTREVDVIVANNGESAPGTMEEDGRRMTIKTSTRRARRIKLPSVLPGSEGEPKSAKKMLATDSKDPTTHMDQLEHQTGNDGPSRTWKQTSEHLDEGGKNAPPFLV